MKHITLITLSLIFGGVAYSDDETDKFLKSVNFKEVSKSIPLEGPYLVIPENALYQEGKVVSKELFLKAIKSGRVKIDDNLLAGVLLAVFSSGEGLNFKKDLFPLLKKSSMHYKLFEDFDFHPTYLFKEKGKIRTIVSYSPGKSGSIQWKYYVTFSLLLGQDGNKQIGNIQFSVIRNYPCHLEPKEVHSIDELNNLITHKISYEDSLSIEIEKTVEDEADQPLTAP